ncbi:MAG: PilN domain-containing protein [Gammaproteobacteria bacterium]
MPKVNLLPWRAEKRTKNRNQFFIGLGASLVAAGLAVLASNFVMEGIISNQNSRNALLKTEIAALDKRIAEILELEAKKERLLARMEIIEQLQRSRPEIVHVFDELVRTLPDGVRLTSIKQTSRRLEIKGDAESNTRVSAFMRNIDKSKWLTQPDLQVVEVREAGAKGKGKKAVGPVETGEFARRSSQFTVSASQVSTAGDEEVTQ